MRDRPRDDVPPVILSDDDLGSILTWVIVAVFLVGIAVGCVLHVTYAAVRNTKPLCVEEA